MNAVIYYSNTGYCKSIAEYLADKSGFDLTDLYDATEYPFETVILVFPVHCQNIPKAVTTFLQKLTVKYLVPVAAYGRACRGNVLYELQKKYRRDIVAAAFVPTGHAYLQEEGFAEFEKLDPVLEKLKNPAPVVIPKSYKNPLADIASELRSRAGVKLYPDAACTKCGTCTAICKNGGIVNGKPNKNCIRCLKCVAACPEKALHFSLRPPMRQYLKNRKRNDLIIYI